MERWNNAEKKQWKISGIERPWGINRELVMRDPKKKKLATAIQKNMMRVIGAFMSW